MNTNGTNGTNGTNVPKRLRVISLVAQNFKGLKAVEITPRDRVTSITGKNGAGKSSVLDSIFAAFGGKKALPSKPIRRGEQTAIIKLDLGEVRITRKFSGEDSSVVVEAESGARFPSPQKMLDALYAELTFDPLKFSTAEPRAQLETLRGLVKLEVDVDALDGLNARDYQLRTEWNHRFKSFDERVKTVEQGVDWDRDVTEIDVSALVDQVGKAFEHNNAVAEANQRRVSTRHAIETHRANAAMKRDQVKRLLAEAKDLEDAAEADELALAQAAPVAAVLDVTAIRHQITEAQKENTLREHQRRQREQLALAKQERDAAKAAADALTAAMDARRAQKEQAISAAQMPVEGLSFGEGEVLYNSVPLAQASAAERLRVSFAIAIAQNPALRVALIRDGSLLDDDSMALIEQMAEQHEFQVFLERVDANSPIGIRIENGEVAAIDGVLVEREVADETSAVVGA